jgi:hypothetical protein
LKRLKIKIISKIKIEKFQKSRWEAGDKEGSKLPIKRLND